MIDPGGEDGARRQRRRGSSYRGFAPLLVIVGGAVAVIGAWHDNPDIVRAGVALCAAATGLGIFFPPSRPLD